ncbi:MAG: glycosyltransferase [Victivallales bacterium]|jgi:GT2 family glycosyltransferase|nr:glycosyltransferase [Victivallales bacterium]
MQKPEVTVIVPNYKTVELTKLCLRSLRKHSNLERIKVVIVDNGSQDASTEYLRGVEWITLIERQVEPGETGFEMHAKALDLAFAEVDTPYVMIMHTDTIVVNDLWLDFLINRLIASPKIAGIGSWKLEVMSRRKKLGKKFEIVFRKIFKRKNVSDTRYLRSHCALYRTNLVREVNTGFADGESAGKALHLALVSAGYDMRIVEPEELLKFIRHLNHATMILNPSPRDRKTSKPLARQRIERELEALHYRDILAEDTLDRLQA